MATVISGKQDRRVDNKTNNDLTVAANTYQGIRDIHFTRKNETEMECQDCGATVGYNDAVAHAANHPAPSKPAA